MREKRLKYDLTEGPLLSRIILFSLPLIATAVLQLLFNTADIIVVGRWGGSTPEECETALAAVGACGSLANLIVQLFMGLSVGAGVCVAHEIGAKRQNELESVVHTAVIAAAVSGVLVTVVGLAAARPLLALMKTDPDVLDAAVLYMRAYFCGMPASMVYNYCAAMLRSAGDTVRPLRFLSIAGIVNVALNLVMVLVFHMGALGVGVATAASQWVSCVLILRFMLHTDGLCHLEWKKLRVDPQKLRKILFIGLPAGFQSSLFSLSNVVIQSSINWFGKVVMAGNTAASNLDAYVYATQNALYHASLTFVGQNIGARKYDRVRKSILYCTVVVLVVGVGVGGFMYLFGQPLLSIYVPHSPDVIEAGMIRLGILGTTYFLCGLMEIGCGALRGLGKSIEPMIICLLGSCAFRIVWVYTVFDRHRSLWLLYLSYPLSWALTTVVLFLFCFLALRKNKSVEIESR